ncbi:MAG: Rrf2 family transcriptional regulator, partial [Lachnospiraceae bacterium]|nr:Rrf2 family transcriptional regulator [Lachnospiraceae bacterium]
MQFSSKLAIATHILLVIAEFSEKEKVTSDVIAGS